jgi:hypothetical protein
MWKPRIERLVTPMAENRLGALALRCLWLAGALCLAGAPELRAAAHQTPGAQGGSVTLRRAVLVVPDTGRAPVFPDSTWIETAEVAPGHALGVRVEVTASDSPAALRWLLGLDLFLYHSGGDTARARSKLAPVLTHGVKCVTGDCQGGGVFAAYGYVGTVPARDTVKLMLRALPDTPTYVVPVWERAPSRFALGASIGAAVPLNSGAGHDVVRRAGLNGRLLVGTMIHHGGVFEPRASGWLNWVWEGPVWLASVAAQGVVLPFKLMPSARTWQGPLLVEGEFLLGLAALQHDTTKADSAARADSSQGFRQTSEGYVRIELPLVDFGNEVSLRLFGQGGFVTVQNMPNYWSQQYFGARLGMDAADPSGRQSYIEVAFGRSENLRPVKGRLRVVVQLRVPETPLVFQFNVNYHTHHDDPLASDNPVMISAYSALDLQDLFRLMGGKPGTISGK